MPPPRKANIAFTLAEVLITLGIIGVVAALVIPQQIVNYRKKATAVKLKKTYSILSQVLNSSIAENNQPIYWQYSDGNELFQTYISPYIKDVKYINGNAQSMCGKNSYVWFNKIGISSPITYRIGAIEFADGTCVGLPDFNKNFNKDIIIDINGNKQGPNKAGVDLFMFYFDNNKITTRWTKIPYDNLTNKNLTYGCNPKSSLGGWYCAEKIMRDNWEIKY